MSLAYSITIRDNATPELERKMDLVSPSRLIVILGPGLTVFVQRQLLANGSNKRGWPTTRFWPDAARGTSWTNEGDTILISINKIGVRQRYYGGPIRPVTAKALAIPISPVSYGHVPADFPGLFIVNTVKGAFLCQHGEQQNTKGNFTRVGRSAGGNAGRRVKAELNFLFKLVGGVDQDADPSVIPSDDEMAETGLALIERAIA